MSATLTPQPNGTTRANIAARIRNTAAENARDRAPAVAQTANGDLAKALQSGTALTWAVGTFTKGLVHDEYGQVSHASLEGFIGQLNKAPANTDQLTESPFPEVYTSGVPAKFEAQLFKTEDDGAYAHPSVQETRGWESPLSGHTYDLQGCDADATGMAPAPEVGSAELAAEMAEVYCAALIRDEAFADWGDSNGKVVELVDELKKLPFYASENGLNERAKKRRLARFNNGAFNVNAFLRGSTKGSMKGPYISQFMLVGNEERGEALNVAQLSTGAQPRARNFGLKLADGLMGSGPDGQFVPKDGFIQYGSQTIAQQQRPHKEKVDHMTTWSAWRDVQNGIDLRGVADKFEDESRFISTPRDLATYVHFDALYQAYLNAVLILNSMNADTDIGLPEGGNSVARERDAFATFGGPHILSLVTEVATRALKAVRRQKFNVHLRSRPEVIGAALSLTRKGGDAADKLGPFKADCDTMAASLAKILDRIAVHNKSQNGQAHIPAGSHLGPIDDASNALLPMAFPEGSPMHAAYGAGHATVAGACVTVVKAFFEMFEIGETQRGSFSIHDIIDKTHGYPGKCPEHLFGAERLLTGGASASNGDGRYAPLPTAYQATSDGASLQEWNDENLSIQGELDKLAANISIGRNFAGVHYYTDYYDSIRMGERIAVSILQEQMLTYREPVTMRFNSFDGDRVMIAGTGGSRGSNDALVFVWDKNGKGGSRADYHHWWNKHR